jgi:hypothetical protein
MPYIPTLRLFRWLWVAWHENDLHARSHRRFGWSEDQARNRVFDALPA